MRRLLLSLAGMAIGLLVLAQVFLPSIAEKRVRSDLAEHGSQVHVSISALPAIELLWGRADDVKISVESYDSAAEDDGGGGDGSLADLLAQTKATGKLDVSVGTLNDRLLTMHDVRLHKSGDTLTATVGVRQSDLDSALPAHLKVTGTSEDGGISVQGQTSVFGEDVDAQGTVSVDDGTLVLAPEDDLLGDLASFTVFEDHRVAVDAIGARTTGDGFTVTARGHLR